MICLLGPMTNTVNEFWKMVWQYDCGKIVMLTNIFEDGKVKLSFEETLNI